MKITSILITLLITTNFTNSIIDGFKRPIRRRFRLFLLRRLFNPKRLIRFYSYYLRLNGGVTESDTLKEKIGDLNESEIEESESEDSEIEEGSVEEGNGEEKPRFAFLRKRF